MQIHLYQTKHTIGDFNAIRKYLESKLKELLRPGIHLFPELFLTGYPLQDLVLQKTFIEKYLEMQQWLEEFCQKHKFSNSLILMGGLNYHFDINGLPQDIQNCAFALGEGKVKNVYTKILLPNYDIFDEKKYFIPGNQACVIEYQGKKIGVLICEDMWVSSLHPVDPVKLLVDKNEDLDLVVNLSASPLHLGKEEKRIIRGKELSSLYGAPFAYCNRVGGEDEILFDGGSFIVNGESEIWRGNLFHIDQISLDIPPFSGNRREANSDIENTWESLFSPSLDKSTPPKLPKMTEDVCQQTLQALTFGIQEYANKCGFNKFLVALSGGIDSALVTAIVRLSLREGQSIEAVYMPGLYSAEDSYNWSLELCKNLGIPFKVQPIKFLHRTICNDFKQNFSEELSGLSDENIQSRLRGALIYARSNQTGAMVLNTSNKSEIAVGYSTLYGDSVGALSVLGDLYKSEVFALSNYINTIHKNLIPEGIITRPPSAELRENQKDSQSLPPYERLDAMLEGILSYRLGLKELQGSGFLRDELEKVYGLYTKSEYKRKQFCPIVKVRAKSFGFGYRIPICKK